MDVSTMFQPVQQLGMLLENVGFFIILLLLMLLVTLVHTFWLRTSQQFPPGPWPWPIVGNLLILGKAPHIKLADLAKQYGPLMYMRLGSVNVLVASSPAMAKEFLKTQDHVFQHRPPLLLTELVGNNFGFGVISGSTWQFIRRICSNELFTMRRIQSFQPLRTKEIQETIKEIYMEAQEGKVMDVNAKLSSFSTNHMTQLLFGKR
jgi:cytochrome P450